MTTLLVGALLACFASWVFTHGARLVAPLVGAMDSPDNSFRKFQRQPMPCMGGIPIFLAVLLPLAALLFLLPENYVSVELLKFNRSASLAGLIIGGTIAVGMGFVDDIFGLRPFHKLLFQVFAASVAYSLGFAIDYISLPFLNGIHLGWFSYPFTVFWFLACMNAINLADGLDGLAAGLAFFAILVMAVVGIRNGNTAAVFLSATIAAATFGFLIHNFNPAKIYLGDSGSMLLGFWVAALSICCARKATAAVSLLIPIIALGLPIFDTSLAILRRWLRRLPISAGDRQHVHHMLLRLGLSHRNAVLVAYAVCIVLGGLALSATLLNDQSVVFLVLALLAVAATSARIFGGVRPGQIFQRINDDFRIRARSDQARIAVNQAATRLQSPRSPDEIWAICQECFPILGLDHVYLALADRSPGAAPHVLAWNGERDLSPDSAFSIFPTTPGPSPAAARDTAGTERLARGAALPFPPNTWAMHLEIRDGAVLIGELAVLRHVHHDLPLPDTADLLLRLREAIQSCCGKGEAAAATTPRPAASVSPVFQDAT